MNTAQTIQNKTELALAAFLRSGRLFHAVLVEGSGDLFSTAQALAKFAVCEAGCAPCNSCRHCQKAAKGIHPDILVYGGEGTFSVDLVRTIRAEAFIKPNEADHKVFLLQNAQNMTVQAQNALLKILEEPPKGVLFILTCDNKAKLLTTVLSRVTLLSLEDESLPAQEESETEALAVQVLTEACIGSEYAALALLLPYEKKRETLLELLEAMRLLAISLVLQRHVPSAASGLVLRLSRLQATKIIAIIEEAQNSVRRNANQTLLATALTAKLRLVVEKS